MNTRFFFTTALLLTVVTVLLASGMCGTASAAIINTKDSADFNTLSWEGDSVPAAIYGIVASPEWTSDGSNNVIVQDGAAGMAGSSGAFSAANGWTAEWRMKLDVNNLPATVLDGRAALNVHLADDSATAGHFQVLAMGRNPANEFVVFDNLAGNTIHFEGGDALQFHTVRLAVEGTGGANEIKLYVDGVEVTSPVGAAGPHNRQWWGDEGAVVSSGTAIVDYFRYDTTGAFAPIPEPATMVLLGIGLALMPFGRRAPVR